MAGRVPATCSCPLNPAADPRRNRCWKNSFWLVTLLYPRCAMTALKLFSTQKLDTGTYLVSDYSILVGCWPG